MKTRKRYVRAGAACLAALLTVQGMTLPVEAGEEVKVRSNSQTQMSSDPEAVYVSNYGKSTDQRTINFDSNWKFNLGDVENAQTANFDARFRFRMTTALNRIIQNLWKQKVDIFQGEQDGTGKVLP